MRRTALVLAAASLGLTACTTDPEVWNAIAMGLDQAAADMEWQNRNCHWAPPPGNRYGPLQQVCPGDWNYQPPVVYPTCAPRDRDCDGYRDGPRRDRDRDGRRHRDRDDD
ncbi:MAG TPA: hypothetical protein VGR32_05450 [Brevundimonas sp.]|jgi:hypothetical protein|uniref:hypothetical protein n=1 Tax=Brevundimonas sp. TaxID=1871086 RepID=UPI002DF596EE|nr:hypothetical protein [Brevundimonas sp.]